tara:strand:+ start:242 stop:445 length:204 start_codon:yes stop_codon:yes gene_type:complete
MHFEDAAKIRKEINDKIRKSLESIVAQCDRIIKLVDGSSNRLQIIKGLKAKKIRVIADVRYKVDGNE